ncbi:nucleotidyltransferase [Tenacibaculum sp. Bg11-29]|uniref:SMODS domain-containing nucleotidyltransferase n=1 Tax=Tenacibaculum sp. Bg11-29 TaxID=2058306 RepID=UPI000C34E040|nr:nucleotidyltransferase [Tenacibaculum sp. Bg11-29]PKH50346.1 nucleotidyltransferase [Tenacibaculum sp. Bg11-29]
MAKKVIAAFNEFMSDTVNLNKNRVKEARSSRDWLVKQIKGFPTDDNDFPFIHPDLYVYFGSFARRTKKRPLDDIDIIIVLHAKGNSYNEYLSNIEITATESADRQLKLCHDNTRDINSVKVINKFIKALEGIDQYKHAEIKRNQESATLQLKSKDWNFDIVPAFITNEDINGKTFYLIPDGKGNWKKTDPRLDRDRTTKVNQDNKGRILNVIRAVKYWNKRPTMPTMGSYLLENMILDYYENSNSEASEYVDIELVNIFKDLKSRVHNNVNDPKNIQGNINNLSSVEKNKISNRASIDYDRAKEARKFEREENHKESINKWREIFGIDFPKYE